MKLTGIKDFFKDGKGQSSMMRVIMFFMVACIMVPWAWISIQTGTLIAFSEGSLYVLGLALGGKSVQKLFEAFTEKTNPKDVVIEVFKQIKQTRKKKV